MKFIACIFQSILFWLTTFCLHLVWTSLVWTVHTLWVLRLSNTIGTIVLDDPKSKQRGVEYIYFQNWFHLIVQGSCLAMKMLVSLSGHFSRHFAQKNSLRFCEIKTIPVGWMILVKKSLLHPKSQCVYSFEVITILLFHEISSVGIKLNLILLNEWKKSANTAVLHWNAPE